MKLFDAPTKNLEQFENLCVFAKKHGGTHVSVSHLPDSQWQWELDRYDPYPSWNMKNPSILKIFTPDKLKLWVNQEYAEKAKQLIAERGKILKKYGLKGAFSGAEPAYLEKGAFEAYPQLRGPACEKPKRSRKTYYAPCVDNHEVLEMYMNAVKELYTLAEVEYFGFLTNDSGAGLCWSHGLYAGVNGNSDCEHIVFGERVRKFLDTIQNAAGGSAIISMGGSIHKHEVDGTVKYLGKNQVFQGKTVDDKPIICGMGLSGTFFSTGLYPVKYLPQPLIYIRGYMGMMNAQNQYPDISSMIAFEQAETDEWFKLYEFLTENPVPKNNKECDDLLYKYCEKQVGAEYANDLYEIYGHIYTAREGIGNIHGDGPLLLTGTVNQRWLTRPLVSKPLELPDEDRKYYREYLFQSNSEEEAEDLANMQGTRFLGGPSAVVIIVRYLTDSLNHTKAAIELAYKLSAVDEGFDLLARRLKVLACVYRNIINIVLFQEKMDKTDFENPPFELPDKWQKGDQLLHEVNNILANELDNMRDLKNVLSTGPFDLMELADTPEDENIFIYSPEIIKHIDKKVDIMNRHKDEFKKYYRRNS